MRTDGRPEEGVDQEVENTPTVDRRELLKRAARLAGSAIVAGPLLGSSDAWARERDSTFSIWYLSDSPSETKVVEKFSDAFGRANHLHATVAPYTYDSINKTLPLALRGKRGPDVAYTDFSKDTTVKFGVNGLLVDLSHIAKQRGWTKRIPQDITNFTNLGDPRDRTWGIPYSLVTVGNYYNKDIFDNAGIMSPPTTFGEYESALAKLKASGVTPFAVGAKDYELIWMLDQLTNGYVPFPYLLRTNDIPNLKDTFNTPEYLRCFEIIQTWAQKGYFQDDFLGMSFSDSLNLFLQGNTAINVNESTFTSTIAQTAKFPVHFFATPQIDPRRPRHMGGFQASNDWIIPKSGNVNEALRYLDWVTGEQVATALWNHGITVAYRFKKIPPIKVGLQREIYEAMQKAKVGIYGFGATAKFILAGTALMQELATGRISPQEAADKATAALHDAARQP